MDAKYMVFKAEDDQCFTRSDDSVVWGYDPINAIPDAVVIRHRDIFAAPALFTYSNQILSLVELLEKLDPASLAVSAEAIKHLRELAQFFHDQAMTASQHPDKHLPD